MLRCDLLKPRDGIVTGVALTDIDSSTRALGESIGGCQHRDIESVEEWLLPKVYHTYVFGSLQVLGDYLLQSTVLLIQLLETLDLQRHQTVAFRALLVGGLLQHTSLAAQLRHTQTIVNLLQDHRARLPGEMEFIRRFLSCAQPETRREKYRFKRFSSWRGTVPVSLKTANATQRCL